MPRLCGWHDGPTRFPNEFDRAIPVINHKKVDLLLMRIDFCMAQYEFVSAGLPCRRKGRSPQRPPPPPQLLSDLRRMRPSADAQAAPVLPAECARGDCGPCAPWWVYDWTDRSAGLALDPRRPADVISCSKAFEVGNALPLKHAVYLAPACCSGNALPTWNVFELLITSTGRR